MIWATWPSTQTRPSRAIHSAMSRDTVRTGMGCSGLVSSGKGCPSGTYDGVVTTTQPMAPGDRRVLLAAPRGYCAGVDRAVITVEKALDLYGPPVYVRKQIVHNKHVVATLERRGAVFVDETDEVPEGAIVVFSAHGVAPSVHEEAAARGLRTIDATCPLVTKVHHEARRFAAEGYQILLIGHEGHEEVVGTSGEAPEHITLVDGPAAADTVEIADPTRVAWLSQTTLSVDETDADGRRAPAPAARCCSTRRATTSATRPRTASPR